MKISSILRTRLIRSFKEPYSLLFIILAVIISVQSALYLIDKNNNPLKVAIVSEDKGELGYKLIEELSKNENFSMELMSRDEALKSLNQDRLEIVVIINSNFSEKLEDGEFKNTLKLFSSPSSQAPATISEPLVNGVMMLWMEEISVLKTKEQLSNMDILYDSNNENNQRNQISNLWDQGSVINIEIVEIDGIEENIINSNPINTCIKWFAVFCMFYLIIDASWVFDITKRSLRKRMKQAGIKQWQMISYNSLAPLLICLLGYIISSLLCILLTKTTFLSVFINFPAIIIYLFNLLGITLVTASFLKNILSLMFLAPVLTFINGILSGLLLELPNWAYILKWISYALPGRWLNEYINAVPGALPKAIICCVVWLLLGIFISINKDRRKSILE